MPPKRLLSSTVFRLTLVHLGVYFIAALSLAMVVYWSSARFMHEQTLETIDAEMKLLLETLGSEGQVGLGKKLEQLSDWNFGRPNVYLLFDPFKGRIAGNVPPGALTIDAQVDGEPMELMLGPYPKDRRQPGQHHAVAVVETLPDGKLLLVGRDIEDKIETLRWLLYTVSAGIFVILLLGAVGGYAVSRWMLGRIERVNGLTTQIMAGDLSRRLEVTGRNDEFDELSRNLNTMLERIERLLIGMRQVSDDVAHDLRTPLTRLRARIEVALMHEVSGAEAHEVLEATLRDADRLIETFNALLSIARAEAGAQRGDWETIDLAELAQDVLELYEPLAEEKGITLALETTGPAMTLGHRQLLAQAIANLLDNAVKYTAEGGRVSLRTGGQPAPLVEVADDGPGIPAEERERAKERFVRLDATRGTPGSGLGLSLVDAVAKLHEARFELLDNAPGLLARLSFRPLPAELPERLALAAA